jgi:hypothetical protein
MAFEDFPNATLSTFEYLLLRARYQRSRPGRTSLTLGAAARVYTPNGVWLDQSRRDLALAVDGRLELPTGPAVAVWGGAYSEVVFNSYDAPRPVDFRGGAYRASVLQLGFAFSGDEAVFEPLAEARVGNGRGIDFAIVSDWSVGAGFNVRL